MYSEVCNAMGSLSIYQVQLVPPPGIVMNTLSNYCLFSGKHYSNEARLMLLISSNRHVWVDSFEFTNFASSKMQAFKHWKWKDLLIFTWSDFKVPLASATTQSVLYFVWLLCIMGYNGVLGVIFWPQPLAYERNFVVELNIVRLN